MFLPLELEPMEWEPCDDIEQSAPGLKFHPSMAANSFLDGIQGKKEEEQKLFAKCNTGVNSSPQFFAQWHCIFGGWPVFGHPVDATQLEPTQSELDAGKGKLHKDLLNAKLKQQAKVFQLTPSVICVLASHSHQTSQIARTVFYLPKPRPRKQRV